MLSSFASTRSLRSCLHAPLFRRVPLLIGVRGLPRVAKVTPEVAPPLVTPPSFRQQLYKENPGYKSFADDAEVRRPPIARQVAFVILGSCAVFYLAAGRTNRQTDDWTKALKSHMPPWASPTSEQMNRAQYLQLGKTLQNGVDKIQKTLAGFPKVIQHFVLWSYAQGANAILVGTEGNRIAWSICAVNGVVWLMWQFRKMQPMMQRGFLHHPLSGLSYTLLTSTFSHKSFIHLLFNSMALSGFGYAATLYLMREQRQSETHLKESTTKWHFVAFYVSAGLFASLVSHAVATRIRFPRLLKQLTSSTSTPASKSLRNPLAEAAAPTKKPASDTILPSLGASGAIYAAVVLSALAFPEAQVSLIIPPSFPIPITWAVGGMVCLDIVGFLRGWRLLDHAAHLGGAAFGAFYYVYGPHIWDYWRTRELGVRRYLQSWMRSDKK